MALIDHHISPSKQISTDVLAVAILDLFFFLCTSRFVELIKFDGVFSCR